MEIFGSQHSIIQIWFALILFYQVVETVFYVLVRGGAVEKSSLVLGHYLLAVDVLEIKAVQIWEVFADLVQLGDARQYPFVVKDLDEFMRQHTIWERQQPQILTHLREELEDFFILSELEIQDHVYHNVKLRKNLDYIL